MRYDTRIVFVAEIQGAYDDASGNYAPASLVQVVAFGCIIEAPPLDTTAMKYGDKRQGALHIHLQRPLTGILPAYAILHGERHNILEMRYGGSYYLLAGEVF